MATLEQIKQLFASSDAQMKAGFAGMQAEIKNFKDSVSKEITEFKDDIKITVENSAAAFNAKIEGLEQQVKHKDDEICFLKRHLELNKRKNNLVLFNVQENYETSEDLDSLVIQIFMKITSFSFCEQDFNEIFRIGKNNGSCRPILVSFLSYRKMKEVFSKKQLFRKENIVVTQDMPKEIIDERKRLQPMITALNISGKKASLRLDEVLLDGKKLSKKEVEDEMEKFVANKKRKADCMNSPKGNETKRQSTSAMLTLQNQPASTLKQSQNNLKKDVRSQPSVTFNKGNERTVSNPISKYLSKKAVAEVSSVVTLGMEPGLNKTMQ